MTDAPAGGIAFAEMTPADLDEARDLWRRTPGIGLYEADDSVEALTAYPARNPGLSRVARAGGVLVGAVLCGHDGRRGAVYHLAVDAGCRGRGVGRDAAAEVLRRVRLCLTAVSLGGVETLLIHPASMVYTHQSDAELAAAGIRPGLLRLSVGVEDAADIIADLRAALGAAT